MNTCVSIRRRRLRLQPLAACLALALSAAPLHADAGRDDQGTAAIAANHGHWAWDDIAHSGLPLLARPGNATRASRARAPATLVVTNCGDAGPGSLRGTVAAAVSGDTVDMSALTCSTITLSSGEIAIPADDLALLGPGRDALTITAHSSSRLLSSHGSIEISDLKLVYGYTRPRGGCVYAQGNVELTRVTVQGCNVENEYSDDPSAYAGGGAFVGGNLTMTSSTLKFNTVKHCSSCGFDADASAAEDDFVVATGAGSRTIVAAGGGAYVGGDATITGSTIYHNFAAGGFSFAATVGGGLAVRGHLTIADSSISTNLSISAGGGGLAIGDPLTRGGSTSSPNVPYFAEFGGGLYLYPGATLTMSGCTVASNGTDGIGGGIYGGTADSMIANSTITGNFGVFEGGGLVIDSVHLTNSTVANNRASFGGSTGGIIVHADSKIESSIIALNTSSVPAVSDLSSGGTPVTISGKNNLVISADPAVMLPPDTLHTNPTLAALADNGGPTLTMALLPGSPAIDTGNNVAGLATDQRGPGFPRVVGVQADIGAYELLVDPIFVDGFD